MSTLKFSSLALRNELISNVASLGFQSLTPVQAQSLPVILQGQDVIAQGKTGSGKTAAFSLGILQKLKVKQFRIQSLVMCPTRELADQVATEIRKLGRGIHNIKVLSLCGGVPIGPQIGSLEHGAHIIVGTPGRIKDHLGRGTLILDHVEMLVLDEADRMLDMGFKPDMETIIASIPDDRQTLLFSATFTDEIDSIAANIQTHPILIKIDETQDQSTVKQFFYQVDNHQHRIQALQLILHKFSPESSIIFCNTRNETQSVADELIKAGFSALPLHGEIEQRDRNKTLIQFANNSVSILVATDVAARGLDIESLDLVINYQLSRDPDSYIHRIGRTGRAGKKGIACTFFTEKEQYKLERLPMPKTTPKSVTSSLPELELLQQKPFYPANNTIQIAGGKKQKLRAGDILGALTAAGGIEGKHVGKIHLIDNHAFVAIAQSKTHAAIAQINTRKMKGRCFKVKKI